MFKVGHDDDTNVDSLSKTLKLEIFVERFCLVAHVVKFVV